MKTLRATKVLVLLAVMGFALWNVASANANVSIGPTPFGQLKVTGDGGDDRVLLRRATDPSLLEFDVNGDEIADGTVPLGNFKSIFVSMGGGNDSFRIDDSNGAFTDVKPATILGGDGGDVLHGGKGDENIVGDAGGDQVVGGPGQDMLSGADGNDLFIWNSSDGEDSISGGLDMDTVAAFGSAAAEVVDIAPNGLNVSMVRDGTRTLVMNGVEGLHLSTRAGSDTITADPEVGKMIKLTLIAGATSGVDNDTVIGSDSSELIAGGVGSDRFEGRGGDDRLEGGEGDDNLFGGAGKDALTGGLGADLFDCDIVGEALDVGLEDTTQGTCIAATEPEPPAPPAPAPPPTAPAPAPPAEAPQSSVQPTPPNSSQAGFLGFGRPAVRATRMGLRVTLGNTSAAPVSVSVAVAERFRSRRAVRYRVVRKTIPTGGRIAVRLRGPRSLRRRIARRLDQLGRVVRRPNVAVTNVATAGRISVRPRLTLRAR